jgi:thymidylate synthase
VGAVEGKTIELEDVSFEFAIPKHPLQLDEIVEPNMPWAEDHFQERVSGKPLNPPPSNEWWPHNVAGNVGHKTNQVFSHTYPERMWPKWANADGSPPREYELSHVGVRYAYGDLSDLVRLFQTRPDTRQGYLPIWFPEDTGAHHGERVPCTLGYHMMQRGGKLGIRYYIRSCDFVRHFRDDVYMAARLGQWVCEEVGLGWTPGHLVLHISSLHAFAADRGRIHKDYNEELSRRLNRALIGY